MNDILHQFLDKNLIRPIRVAVIGDAMVDEYFYIKVKKISPEFPIPVMISDTDKPTYSLPGGAANVAYQFKSFNVHVELISFLDDDAETIFKNAGLNTSFSTKSLGVRIPRKRRFYCDDFPTYRWDVEKSYYGMNLAQHVMACQELYEKCKQDIDKFDVVIFSDYDKGVFNDPLLSGLCRDAKCSIVDPKKHIDKWEGCTVFKPNSVEAASFVSTADSINQCLEFRRKLGCKYVFITEGGKGVTGWDGESAFQYYPFVSNKPVSVIGAGDCFIAFLAMSLAHGFNARESAEIAFQAGAIYVQRKHNEPVTVEQLMRKVNYVSAKCVSVDGLRNRNYKLVFTNGCFDCLHAGHVDLLYKAKSFGDKLVVAVNSDQSVARLKQGRPIISLSDRMRILASLESVDFVIPFDSDTPLELIKEIKPDVLVKGGDYTSETIVGADIVPEVRIISLIKGISTTDIIKKIKAIEF